MEYQIIDLPREEWENTIVPIGYTTGEYYDITVEQKADGFVMGMKKQNFPQSVTRRRNMIFRTGFMSRTGKKSARVGLCRMGN